jgi:hypothetical protein
MRRQLSCPSLLFVMKMRHGIYTRLDAVHVDAMIGGEFPASREGVFTVEYSMYLKLFLGVALAITYAFNVPNACRCDD